MSTTLRRSKRLRPVTPSPTIYPKRLKTTLLPPPTDIDLPLPSISCAKPFQKSSSSSHRCIWHDEPEIPHGVVNIDEKRRYSSCCLDDDDHCTQQSLHYKYIATYGRQYYDHLLQIESERSTNPLHSCCTYLDQQHHLSDTMRTILIDWLIEVAEEYKLHNTTLHTGVRMVDRVLSAEGFIVEKDMLQCVGCACLLLASKMEEINPPTADDFVFISDNTYTRRQVLDMERRVGMALEFRLQSITASHFVQRFVVASGEGKINGVLERLVNYLTELSLLKYEFVTKKGSLLAAAAVYLARVTLGMAGWSKTLRYYTGYEEMDLESVVMDLYDLMYRAESSEYKSVFTKYKHGKYGRVAMKTVPREEDLGFFL